MAKKAIHHFNRGLMIGFKIIGFFAVLGLIGWITLLYRLSQGPIDVGFLTDRVERALNERQAGFRFDVSSTVLTWGGRFEPIELEMREVQIRRDDSTPILVISRIGMQLSKRAAVFGQFIPKTVKIYSPALRLIRWEDGHFTMNLGEAPRTPVIIGPMLPEPAVDEQAHVRLINNLLAHFRERPFFGVLGFLQEIRVTDASVYYEDRALGTAWRARRSSIVVAQRGNRLSADSIIDVDMGDGKSSLVRATVGYDWDGNKTEATVYFSGFVPALAAQQSDRLKALSDINLPLKGSIGFRLDENFRPQNIRFIIGGEPGTFNIAGLYPKPLAVQGLYVSGVFDADAGKAMIDALKVNFGKVVAAGRVRMSRIEGGKSAIELQGLLGHMPMDILAQYWPEKLAHDARAWVTGHLSKGVAEKATINALLTFDPEGAGRKVTVEKLGGDIDFTGIKVDYFPPLMPVTDVAGKATYDMSSFNLDITGGKLGDMDVTKSIIHITDLDKITHDVHSNIDINVSLTGPLKTALSVLDSKPLGYPKKLGLSSASVGGRADVDVSFRFPLHHGLMINEVDVSAKATAHDVTLKDVVAGMPLSGKSMNLSVDKGELSVSGKGELAAMPVDFSWTRHFSEKTPVAAALKAKIALDAAGLHAFGLPDDMRFGGAAPTDVDYRLMQDGRATVSLSSDIGGASFAIPAAGYVKTGVEKGSFAGVLHLKNGSLEKISALRLETERARAAGDVFFTRAKSGDLAIKKASFADLRLGDTAISLEAEVDASGAQMLKVRGEKFDASSFFDEKSKVNSDAEARKAVTPLKVSVDVARLITGKDKYVDRARLILQRNEWQRIERLEMDAVAGGKPFTVRYLPSPKAGYTLAVDAGNAGAFLSALGFTEAVRGGRLAIRGNPDAKSGPRDMRGSVTLVDFVSKDTPVLARLLNAMSLTGIIELMNNKGISFKKARANFRWIDRGAPNDNANVRLLKIDDGQTSGASLGLTFEGNIDNWKNIYDLNGTIVPVSDLNKLVSMIPLVGDVLTAGGEGIFAATYTVKGSKDQPVVTVNPLAALAPGVLRKIFFEN